MVPPLPSLPTRLSGRHTLRLSPVQRTALLRLPSRPSSSTWPVLSLPPPWVSARTGCLFSSSACVRACVHRYCILRYRRSMVPVPWHRQSGRPRVCGCCGGLSGGRGQQSGWGSVVHCVAGREICLRELLNAAFVDLVLVQGSTC